MKKLVFMILFIVFNFTVSPFLSFDKDQSSGDRQPASMSKKTWAFNYKDLSKKPFQIKKEAASYEEAYKSASRECFQQLTGGKYPGEEKGLDIIDICANPKI